MVRSREASFALVAFEGFRAGVLPIVTCQLVGSREPPLAPGPVALVGLLSGVRPLVGFQMRTLGVHLLTIGIIALVDTFFAALRLVSGGV